MYIWFGASIISPRWWCDSSLAHRPHHLLQNLDSGNTGTTMPGLPSWPSSYSNLGFSPLDTNKNIDTDCWKMALLSPYSQIVRGQCYLPAKPDAGWNEWTSETVLEGIFHSFLVCYSQESSQVEDFLSKCPSNGTNGKQVFVNCQIFNHYHHINCISKPFMHMCFIFIAQPWTLLIW